MAALFDLAVMTVSSAPGVTSNVPLASAAVIGGVTFVSFAAAGATNGTSVDYSLLDPLNGGSEIGTSIYSSTNGTLLISRTPTISTNANAAINASSASIVRISARAETLQNASMFTSGTLAIARINGGAANQFVQGDGTFQLENPKLLNTLTAATSATLSDTTSLTSTYSSYDIVFSNLVPSAGANTLQLQVHSGGAFQTTTYLANVFQFTGGATATSAVTTSIPCSQVSGVSTVTSGVNGTIRIYNPSQTVSPKHFTGLFSFPSATPANVGCVSTGYWNGGNGAIDGFQVLFASGTIISGTIKIYGIV